MPRPSRHCFRGPLVVRDGCVLIGEAGDYALPVWPDGASLARNGSGRLAVLDADGAGEPQPFQLSTDRGVDFRVDFDGSFWQSYEHVGDAPSDPFQRGSMTLLAENAAVFEWRGGALSFVRNDPPEPPGACFERTVVGSSEARRQEEGGAQRDPQPA